MGKKWHFQRKRQRSDNKEDSNGGGGGGSANGEQQSKRLRQAEVISLGNVKGHQAVVGTCDVRHDKQATAELVDLLNAVADEIYPQAEEEAGPEGGGKLPAEATRTAAGIEVKVEGGDGNGDVSGASAPASSSGGTVAAPEKSVEDMIRQEAEALRSAEVKTHRFKSVNTSVKGVVMVCVMDPKVDILRLVDALYDEIRTTKMRRSRFLERVTPLQVTSYPELEVFKEVMKPVVSAALPPVAEGVPPLPVETKAIPAASTATTNPAAETEATGATETPAVETSAAKADINEKTRAATTSPPAAATNGAGEEAAALSAAECRQKKHVDTAPSGAKEGGSGVVDGSKDKKTTCDKRWKFRVDLRRRNSGLKRLDLINAVAGAVGEGHSVSMSSPEVTIAVEAIKSVVGGSVLFNYDLNHEYSLSRLQDAVCGAILDS